MRRSQRITSKRRLASHLDVPESTLRGWMNRPEWNFRRKPPWPSSVIQEIKLWAGKHVDPEKCSLTNGSETSRLTTARTAKVLREARILALREARLRGQLVDRELVREELAAHLRNWSTAIIAAARASAAALDAEGLLVPGARQRAETYLHGRAEALCNQFAQRMTDAVESAR